jgi:sec-independent protein translocase protein TatA
MLGRISPTEILLIGGIILLFFGSKKIPELARGLGESVKLFKREIKRSGELPSANPENHENKPI